jgi:hypothetical protein
MPFKLPFAGFFQRRRRLFCTDRQVDHGYVRRGHANGHTGQFAIQGRDDLAAPVLAGMQIVHSATTGASASILSGGGCTFCCCGRLLLGDIVVAGCFTTVTNRYVSLRTVLDGCTATMKWGACPSCPSMSEHVRAFTRFYALLRAFKRI